MMRMITKVLTINQYVITCNQNKFHSIKQRKATGNKDIRHKKKGSLATTQSLLTLKSNTMKKSLYKNKPAPVKMQIYPVK
jgi:two-component sensor histidine kinase